MDIKLTLKLDQNIIEKAKLFAKAKQTSLSSIIENYLQKITIETESEERITPLVKSLSGVIQLPADYNHKKDYGDRLLDKYK